VLRACSGRPSSDQGAVLGVQLQQW
jgi:hypothetical protein